MEKKLNEYLIPELTDIVGHYYEWQVGDYCDALDKRNIFCPAKIIRKTEIAFEIQFFGWPDQWNEYIPINSTKLQPFFTHTRNRKSKATCGDKVNFRFHNEEPREGVVVSLKDSFTFIKTANGDIHKVPSLCECITTIKTFMFFSSPPLTKDEIKNLK